MKQKIENFLKKIVTNDIEVYNEFSLQHELGIYLRSIFPDYKVQFERNVSYFNVSKTIKKEIDIVIYNGEDKYAIELKFPLNGQYPEQMFSFVKDIKFMEQLKQQGFTATYAVTLVKDKNFVIGTKTDGIYRYFRANENLRGTLTKPTGAKNELIELEGNYRINWTPNGKYYYYVVEI